MDTPAQPILIVDDDDFQRRIIRIKLQTRGFEVNEARDGIEAIGFLSEQHYSLILLDVVMPRLNGWEVLDQIRGAHGKHLPVLMMTARDTTYDEKAAVARGANGYLTKPIDFSDLYTRIASFLDQDEASHSPGEAEDSPPQAEAKTPRKSQATPDRTSESQPELKLSLLEGLTNNLPGVVFRAIADNEYNVYVSYQSNGLKDFLGYSWDSVHDILATTDEASRSKLNKQFRQRAKLLETILVNFPVKAPNGTRGWAECRATPHRLPSGETVWDAVLLDVSDKKELEQQLEASRNTPQQSDLLSACLDLATAVENGTDTTALLTHIRALQASNGHEEKNVTANDPYRDDEGFVNQCPKCRRVQNMQNDGAWEQVQQWSRHMPLNTRHTICADCTYDGFKLQSG